MPTTNRYYELLENAPDFAKETAALFQWSDNYDHGQKPSQLFLDLTGISADYLDCEMDLYDYNARAVGYLELDMLADALKEYAARPQDVARFVTSLLEADGADQDEEN